MSQILPCEADHSQGAHVFRRVSLVTCKAMLHSVAPATIAIPTCRPHHKIIKEHRCMSTLGCNNTEDVSVNDWQAKGEGFYVRSKWCKMAAKGQSLQRSYRKANFPRTRFRVALPGSMQLASLIFNNLTSHRCTGRLHCCVPHHAAPARVILSRKML